jgi:hypothetical protein
VVNKIAIDYVEMRLVDPDTPAARVTVYYHLTDTPGIQVVEEEIMDPITDEYILTARSFWPEGLDFT